MSGQARPYIRIYFETRDDPRFEHAYGCDPCWAAYSRLLMDAEASFPSAASLPSNLKPHPKARLVEDGIIELRPHGCFIVHGLQKEREQRSNQARDNVERRWSPAYGAPADTAVSPSNNGRSTSVLLTDILAEPSLDEPIRTEPRHAPESGPECWEWVTLRYPSKMGNPQLWDWLERLADEFGVVRLWEVLRVTYAADRNLRTLLSRTEASLCRERDRQESTAERQRLAAQRAAVPPLQVAPVPELSKEEEDRQVAEWKAAHE